MMLHYVLLKNSFPQKKAAEGEEKAFPFLRGHKRIVSFFQKKSGYVLALGSWPDCSLPSSWGSTLNGFGCCSLSAGAAFIPVAMQVAWVDRDRSRFKLLLTNSFKRYFLSLQVGVHT